MNKYFLTTFIVLLFVVLFANAKATITSGCNNGTYNYTCGDNITESCTLNGNLTSSGTCFTVGASDIVINGA